LDEVNSPWGCLELPSFTQKEPKPGGLFRA